MYFADLRCNFIEEFHLCYDVSCRCCVFAYGRRPSGDLISVTEFEAPDVDDVLFKTLFKKFCFNGKIYKYVL